jgi:predicted extracellular nuclease
LLALGGFASGAACAQAVASGLVINEIDYDQPGTDIAEFIEIKNAGDVPVSLAGHFLELVNGSGGAIYDTINLPAILLAPGDYFVVCANAATVPNCDLDDGPDTNFIQNGAPDAVALRNADGIVDTVSYEGDTVAPYTEGSGFGLADTTDGSIARCPDGKDTDRNNIDLVFVADITPGAANSCVGVGVQDAFIHEVQGAGSRVAITTQVRVEAVVVGDFQASDQLRGFFLQEEDADADANPATSEGIFVFCSGCPTDVKVGDLVRVTGTPGEFFGMSQLTATQAGDVEVLGSGNPLPTPAVVNLPANGSTQDAATFEHVEGMLVTFADPLYVSEYFQLARFGQLVLTAGGRPAQFTDANEPGTAAYADFLAELNTRRIILDDDNNIQNAAIAGSIDKPYFWPRPGLSNSNLVRGGDRIDTLTGVMHWSFAGQSGTDAWRVRPVDGIAYDFVEENPRPENPAAPAGLMRVASFNVLNYFTTLDSRGADSTAELDRQRAKTVAAICAMNADVVGLIEIENNSPVAIEDLLNEVNGVNAACGPYSYIDTGMIGGDAIAVAFIYRRGTVSPVGGYAVLDSSVDPRFIDTLNRPALAQAFAELESGEVLTIVVNHLKSKGSSCASVGDPDLGDGQANCNKTRTDAAAAMVDWLAGDPTGSGDPDVLIIGDLNAYRMEDPIAAIKAGPDDVAGSADDYTDLLDTLVGPGAYSFVFDGQLGYLDHALANASLRPQVIGAYVWHINADEIPVFDYNDGIRDSGEASFERESTALEIFSPDAYRSSDHDPVIIDIGFDSDADGVLDGQDYCAGTVIPEAVPTQGLRGNRWALVNSDLLFDTNGRSKESFSTADTAGCSCEQIIVATGAGGGHEKFGCSTGLLKDWIEGVR